MSSSFITNKEKFLSDIINGILPKTNAVDILVGYFYFSGYVQLSDNLKNKQIRILVGLDVDLQISGHICEVEAIRKRLISRGAVKEEYYEQLVKLINESDFLDTAEKQEQFKMFYGKVLDGTLEIRKPLEPCHSKMYLFAYNDLVNEGGELPGVLITGSSNLSYQGLKGRLELNARFNTTQLKKLSAGSRLSAKLVTPNFTTSLDTAAFLSPPPQPAAANAIKPIIAAAAVNFKDFFIMHLSISYTQVKQKT